MTLNTWETALKNLGLNVDTGSVKTKYYGQVLDVQWDITIYHNSDELLGVHIEYYDFETFMNGRSYTERKYLNSTEFIKKFYTIFRDAKLQQLLYE